MMTLNPEILAIAESARVRMLERQHELDRARADFNHEIRRLHAAGGSMREISDKLGVSHQRIHQIVADGDAAPDPLLRRLGSRLQRGLGGAFTRFNPDARSVVASSHQEAIGLGASTVEPEHLLLALAAPEAGASARALEAAGAGSGKLRAALAHADGSGPQDERLKARASFSGPSKQALEFSVKEAVRRGDDYVGSEHLLLGVLHAESVAELLAEIDVTPDAVRDAL
jgi:hypothetical protein